ncbi:MAG: acyltransferase family protein [Actinomycetota bacterium]
MTATTTTPNLKALAAATPEGRDRYVDFLRALSIAVVVLGHWLMAIVYLRDGRLEGANALDVIPGLWLITWVLQVMPIFFFVGGFSNLVAWRAVKRRGESYTGFMRSRVARLIRPTLIFVLIWTATAGVLAAMAPGSLQSLAQGTELLAKPLWFLAVYVLVVALAPAMIALHERHGARVILVLVGAAAIVDVLRVGFGVPVVGFLNFAFVWLFAHQLGFFYGDGSLVKWSRRSFVVGGALSLGLLGVLTGSGIYSPSMVGMATDRASNNSPPSICLMILTVWLVSAVMVGRPAIGRWLQRPRAWMAVVAANSMIMTVFLWHLTALLVATLVLLPNGFPQPDGGTALWWAWRPAWIGALAIVLAGFVAIFGRFERPRAPKVASGRGGDGASVVFGVVALVAGLAGFAQFGFAHMSVPSSASTLLAQPFLDAALVVLGYRLLTIGSRPAQS